jgi:hypothetical protein
VKGRCGSGGKEYADALGASGVQSQNINPEYSAMSPLQPRHGRRQVFTLFTLGIVVIVLTVIGLGALLYVRDHDMRPVVGFVVMYAGLILTVLLSIHRIVVSAEGKSAQLELGSVGNAGESKASQVHTDTEEVRSPKTK